MTSTPTPTPSLTRRVSLGTLGLLAALLVVLGVAVDLTLGAQVHRDLHDRLVAAASRADALASTGTPPDLLAAQLGGGTVRALLVTADGRAYGDPAISPDTTEGPTAPLPPPPPSGWPPGGSTPGSGGLAPGPDGIGPGPPPAAPGPPPGGPGFPLGVPGPPPSPPDGTATVVVHRLSTGARVILVADTTQATQVIRELRELMLGAGLATLVVAALLLRAVARGALRPLDRLTAVARGITSGDRGRRVRPDRGDTELGRAATAFDGMLDALEDAERQAQDSARRARAAADTAQRAEAETRRFLADAAHELRTPLAGIQVAAEQIATQDGAAPDPESARRNRRAQLLLSEARRAGRLVADMLDLSRIDAGLPLHRQDVDLTGIVDGEVERAAMLAPALTVTRTGVDRLPISADPTRVAQILSNLLDNARRHTPPGGTITVDLRPGGSDGFAEVTVTDTGPGVPEPDRERIFDRLVRLDSARDRDHGGAGLGLPIARALAHAHHGTLECRAHDVGARFRLTLPVTTGP